METNKNPSPRLYPSFHLKVLLWQQHPGATHSNNTGLCTKLHHYYTHATLKILPKGARDFTKHLLKAYVPS